MEEENSVAVQDPEPPIKTNGDHWEGEPTEGEGGEASEPKLKREDVGEKEKEPEKDKDKDRVRDYSDLKEKKDIDSYRPKSPERDGGDFYRPPQPRRRRSRSRSRSPRRRSPTEDRDRRDRDGRGDRDDRESRHRDRDERGRSRSPRRNSEEDPERRHENPHHRPSNKPIDPARKAFNREVAAMEASKRSVKENRVYVGNLSFQVRWNDLKDFMRQAGNVIFAEIMMLPNGMSKGCGLVEYTTPEEAARAVTELNDQTLMGRPLFIREDREDEARYGSAAVAGRAGYNGPGAFARGGMNQGYGGGGGGGGFGHGGYNQAGGAGGSKQLFVGGLPPTVGWQDLKDLFRAAGNILRADVNYYPDGTPKGSGIVVYETERDAQNAIAMYNNFEFQGRRLDVHIDRFPAPGFGPPRGGFGGGFRGGMMGRGRGGFGGGFGRGGGPPGGGGGGRFGQDLYADYTGPDQAAGYQNGGYGGGYGGGGGGPTAPAFGGRGGYAGGGFAPGSVPPSTQIFVRNLPWSTSNEDLVELFQTTGKVEHAEVIFEGGRSKGVGVVQFASVEEAETAIAKFQNYSYGGRPLALEFNARWKNFETTKMEE